MLVELETIWSKKMSEEIIIGIERTIDYYRRKIKSIQQQAQKDRELMKQLQDALSILHHQILSNKTVAHTKCLKCGKDYHVGVDGYCTNCYDFSRLTLNPQRVNLQQAQKDREWLKDIVKVYDKTSITVPTEFDDKIEELRKYLEVDI